MPGGLLVLFCPLLLSTGHVEQIAELQDCLARQILKTQSLSDRVADLEALLQSLGHPVTVPCRPCCPLPPISVPVRSRNYAQGH